MTKVLRRDAAVCPSCNKTHQLRLLKTKTGAVAALGGRPMNIPGVRAGNPEQTYELALALVVEFARQNARNCPLDGWV